MRRWGFIIVSCFVSISTLAQVRVSKLIIKPHEVYSLGTSDILVADTLIMMDSSTLLLNKLKPENFLRVHVGIFGKAAKIDGSGLIGITGRKGLDGTTAAAPCQNGTDGKMGRRGLDGGNAVNLSLYFDQLIIKGKLYVILTGGLGGNGGNGGHGGSGGSGTRYCTGGNGGNGASGNTGGNGGNGGVLTITCSTCPSIEELLNTTLQALVAGGELGYGGRGGNPGYAGIGPPKRSGQVGKPGPDGISGKGGNIGLVKFETN